jgi:carbonic anhydrase/acetyltransferase-like protein (isoleucine patch superfamily)
MTISAYRHFEPRLGERVFIHESAVVIGRVELGDDVSVWPTAVIRGDVHEITIGARTSVQDGCVLHVTHDGVYVPGGRPLRIGTDVTIGHRAVLHACTIGNAVLVGMGAVVLDDVHAEDFVMIGAGSIVTPGTRLVSGGLYVGSPARRLRELSTKEIEFLTYSAQQYVRLKDEYLVQRIR